MVKSTRIIRDTESHEVRFYVSSLSANAELICKTARRHWSVENKLHWILDVRFNEDKGCIRNDIAAENVDIVRKWALNVLNSQKGKNDTIKGMQRRASMYFKYMNQPLTNFLGLA